MKLKRIDGHIFESMIKSGLANLKQNEEKVNAMNVFPVTDGDTGTNMCLTVENGIKYNKINGNLRLTIFREEDTAKIEIEDTGVGIPEESLAHIFERFYRVDKARSRSTGGSGLGLSIVRNLIERNNGQIRVTSKLGEGTEFTITFPIAEIQEDIL